MAPTTFEVMLVDKLRPHPKNIRHEVDPSAELVESIKASGVLQPLVVAPHPTLEGDYTVIAGHHRLAAAKRAGLLEVPTVIRHDLAGDEQQIPAMVIENLQRKDLTATEEADAYQLMLGFEGWDAKRVAKETGSGVRRVRERAKLATLPEDQRKALDSGQLTVERALAIAALDKHPDLQERLQEAAGEDTWEWEYESKRVNLLLEWRKAEPKIRKDLLAAGVQIVDRPEQHHWHHDYPYIGVRAEAFASYEDAAAEGLMVILDEECAHDGAPEWVRAKPTEEEAAAQLSDEDRAAQDAEALANARIDQVEKDLALVVEVELKWINQVLASARDRDEKVMAVIRPYFSTVLTKVLFSYVDRMSSNLFRIAGVEALGSGPDRHEAVEEILNEDISQTAALVAIAGVRRDIADIHAWRPGRDYTRPWFQMREALGWELTDVEKAAQALAAELWPPEPEQDADDDADDEDGDA